MSYNIRHFKIKCDKIKKHIQICAIHRYGGTSNMLFTSSKNISFGVRKGASIHGIPSNALFNLSSN